METKYIWKGVVGAQIRRRINGTTHEHFYTVKPVRCYKPCDSKQWRYANDFTLDQLETLVGEIIPEAKTCIESAGEGIGTGTDSAVVSVRAAGFSTGPTPEEKSVVQDA